VCQLGIDENTTAHQFGDGSWYLTHDTGRSNDNAGPTRLRGWGKRGCFDTTLFWPVDTPWERLLGGYIFGLAPTVNGAKTTSSLIYQTRSRHCAPGTAPK
jgi:hypothetical protein